MTEPTITLPDDLRNWIESVVAGTVTKADRVPGGATREAWFVDTADANGNVQELFLRRSSAPLPERSGFHVLQTEAEVMGALGQAGMCVPRIIGVHPVHEAVLSERVSGATWFYRIKDQSEQVAVARDFIRSLAAIHRLDPRTLGINALGPVKSARDHALDRLAGIRVRGTAPDGSIDPLLRLSVDWLERNVPAYDGPVVLVQGDTGPGNFMYENGVVTAVVDWELCHWGDPMDDIAWLSLRTVQDTFTHLPDRLAEYAELSGHAIDVGRVWYYRLFAECTMTTLYPNMGPGAADRYEGVVARDIGNGIIYRQLHRRLWLEALAAVMGLELDTPTLPEPDHVEEWHEHYDTILGNLQAIVPRITDPLASGWAKGLARMVKYLQETDASGRDFARLEIDEISMLIGRPVHDLSIGRVELEAAAQSGLVREEDYVTYMWHRVARNDHLMRGASGALSERTWPPLVD